MQRRLHHFPTFNKTSGKLPEIILEVLPSRPKNKMKRRPAQCTGFLSLTMAYACIYISSYVLLHLWSRMSCCECPDLLSMAETKGCAVASTLACRSRAIGSNLIHWAFKKYPGVKVEPAKNGYQEITWEDNVCGVILIVSLIDRRVVSTKYGHA